MSVSKLSEELVKAGKDVEVLTTTANGETEIKIKPGLKTIVDGVPVTYFRRVTKNNSHFSPALLLFLSQILKTARYADKSNSTLTNISPLLNIIHIHAWWNLVSVGSCLVALATSNPVILSPRGTLSNYSFGNRKSILKNIFHQVVGKSLLKRCHFHVTSEKEKRDILNIIQPRSITVIPNFVKFSKVHFHTLIKSQVQARISPPQAPTLKLLFLSRIEEKKGLDILFKALHKIKFPYHLTIAGSGNTEYVQFLKSISIKLEIQNMITWIGHQNNDRKFLELYTHDLLILPSHDESFANVVIESLSVGTPVLISSKVGLAEYVLENDFGWVYTHGSNQLTSKIIEAITDNTRRDMIRDKAPRQISIDFNDKQLVDSYIKMYTEISDNR